jgi:hypothetical protein
MEARFRHDFSRVRIHSDGRAADSAGALHAEAYSVGNHVVFGRGRYTPGTAAGDDLLAHELVHTIQQRAMPGSLRTAFRSGLRTLPRSVPRTR